MALLMVRPAERHCRNCRSAACVPSERFIRALSIKKSVKPNLDSYRTTLTIHFAPTALSHSAHCSTTFSWSTESSIRVLQIRPVLPRSFSRYPSERPGRQTVFRMQIFEVRRRSSRRYIFFALFCCSVPRSRARRHMYGTKVCGDITAFPLTLFNSVSFLSFLSKAAIHPKAVGVTQDQDSKRWMLCGGGDMYSLDEKGKVNLKSEHSQNEGKSSHKSFLKNTKIMDFSGKTLKREECNFENAVLIRPNFDECTLEDPSFKNAILVDPTFKKATITGGNFEVRVLL